MTYLTETARQLSEAKQAYEAAFRDHFVHEVTLLVADRFWELQSVLAREVRQFYFVYGRTNGIEMAAEELCRKPLANDYHCLGDGVVPSYSLEEAVRFAKHWEDLKRRLYQPLFDVVEDRSDDGYSDLLDALPLAGRDIAEKALAREFANHGQFERAVKKACPDDWLSGLILNGENYIGMRLYDAAKDAVATQAIAKLDT